MPYFAPIHAKQLIQNNTQTPFFRHIQRHRQLIHPAVGVVRFLFFGCFGKTVARTPKKRGRLSPSLEDPPALPGMSSSTPFLMSKSDKKTMRLSVYWTFRLSDHYPLRAPYLRPFQVTPRPESTFQVETIIMAANTPAPSGTVRAYQPGMCMSRSTRRRQ